MLFPPDTPSDNFLRKSSQSFLKKKHFRVQSFKLPKVQTVLSLKLKTWHLQNSCIDKSTLQTPPLSPLPPTFHMVKYLMKITFLRSALPH